MGTLPGVASAQVVQRLYHIRSEPIVSLMFMDPEAMAEFTEVILAGMYDNC